MKILLTGASSFTGLWFAKALHGQGHHVVAALRAGKTSYTGIRRQRVEQLAQYAELVGDAAFGTDRFLDVAKGGQFDLLCHHGAEVGDYKSPDFDVTGACTANAHRLPRVLRTLQERGLSRVILTGSVFEPNEGEGEQPLRAFSPYGLSKGITSEVFSFWCSCFEVPLGKFVIPNPFGPFEEPRFCMYLVRTWAAGQTAQVRTPLYIRDNIPVSLLASAYAKFAAEIGPGEPFRKLNPSGFVEPQGVFARRFARELAARLRLDCRLELADQTDFPEPLTRVNTDNAKEYVGEWEEAAFWDEVAAYYSGAMDLLQQGGEHASAAA